jgi:rhodanese-related sulfurtransferase
VSARSPAPACTGTISTGGLVALMGAKTPFTLVDGRQGAKEIIPKAKRICSLDFKCQKSMGKALGARDGLIVTYCSGPKCSASTTAAAKLRKAGYTNVIEYREGLAGWQRYRKECLASRNKTDCGQGKCGRDLSKGCGGCSATKKTAKADHEQARICATGLQTLMRAKVPFCLIDARSKRAKGDQGIPGSKVVTEAGFSGQAGRLPKDKETLLVTYCSNSRCGASKKVAAKLRRAGYQNVIVYGEGMQGWKQGRGRTNAAPASAPKAAAGGADRVEPAVKKNKKTSCCGSCGGGCSK